MRFDNYKVPKAVHHQCMWIVKDMERLLRLEMAADEVKQGGGAVYFSDEATLIKGGEVFDEAERKLECIRLAAQKLPPEYRQGTIDSIAYGKPFDDTAHTNTWRRWRRVFIKELAQNLFLI